MTKRSEARTEFLKDTVITAAEGGVNYWGRVWAYDPDEGTFNVKDMENDSPSYTVDLDVVARGWGLYAEKGGSISGAAYKAQALLANRTNGEDGDFDADIADQVVQLGLFGEVVFG